MTSQSTTYPLLTLEKLSLLYRRVRGQRITIEDLELIDHYMTAVGRAGVVKASCQEENILSFEEAIEVIKYGDSNMEDRFAASGLTGSLGGMLLGLMRRVERGQKIY